MPSRESAARLRNSLAVREFTARPGRNPGSVPRRGYAELISLCGGEMVVAPGAKFPTKRSPTRGPTLFCWPGRRPGSRASARKTLAHPLWQRIPAVRRKRVFVVQDELLNTPGPPLVTGALQISRILTSLAGEIA